MLHLLISRDWTAIQDEIFRRIAADVLQEKSGRILMVPELISHEAERELCRTAGDTASRFAEVLSFSRLARRAVESAGSGAMQCLDNGGRVVAMAAAARQLSSKLKTYAAVETKPEFLEGLIDAVDEFKRCCISPSDLMAASLSSQGTLSQKLEELSLLMETYDALCSRGKRDPRDQMSWLLEQLEDSTFAQNHVFYMDGFPDYTRQHMAILEHLIAFSPDVTVGLNCDEPDSSKLAFEKAGQTASALYRYAVQSGIPVSVDYIQEKDTPLEIVRQRLFQGAAPENAAARCLQVFRAETPWAEVMAAANQILTLVRSGCRYRDIALVCPDMASYQPIADLIFHRMHIPLYRSGTEDILQKNIVATVLTALDAALSNFDQRSVMRYLRSALSGMDSDICDHIDNYVYTWGIHGNGWLCDWEYHPDGLGAVWSEKDSQKLAMLNSARKTAMYPLEKLRSGFRKAEKLKDQIVALYSFLEDIRLDKRLSELAADLDKAGDNRGAQILNQLWEILLSALEQMYDVLGDTQWEAEHFQRLFRLLLSQYDVGTIPPVLDAVHMGPITAMRCNHQKHLILIGAQEGNLPAYSGSSGVLTDQDRVALRAMGVPLTGGATEGIQEEFAEIYGVFCGASESISVYYSGMQPSFICRRLSALAGGEKTPDVGMDFALADENEAAAWMAAIGAENYAEELKIGSYYHIIRSRADYEHGTVSAENIRKLYGSSLNLSASQIDRQAECRMSYFLQYGLRVRERKEATLDPAEFGTYVHAVLEKTARCVMEKGGFHKISATETLEIAHRFSDEYAAERFKQIDSERAAYLFRRNIRELDMVVEDLWDELCHSDFEPVGFEVEFGGENALPPISIPNGSISAILRGFVDRVDIWKSAGSSYYRVVDYKTGKKDFDYCDVFNGVGLQMLLYLFALRHSGTDLLGMNAIPAGVQYFPARVPYISAKGLNDDSADDERKKLWKRKGLLLKDETVLQAMDPDGASERLSAVIKKDGTISGDAADRDQLKLLEKYVFRVLGSLVEDIASGNVTPNPYTRGTSHDACRFCPYGSICHQKTVVGRRNYKAMTAQRFWEEVEKEMKPHGR